MKTKFKSFSSYCLVSLTMHLQFQLLKQHKLRATEFLFTLEQLEAVYVSHIHVFNCSNHSC